LGPKNFNLLEFYSKIEKGENGREAWLPKRGVPGVQGEPGRPNFN
jgi:hypothetical protein